MINLRSEKDVYIPVDVPKRRVELVSTQEETQVEEEPQLFTFEPTGVNNQATTSTENDNPEPVGENAVALPTYISSKHGKRELA